MENCPICDSQMNIKYKKFHNTKLLKCVFCGYEKQQTPPTLEELYKIYDSSYYDSWGNNDNAIKQKELYFNTVLNEVKLEKNAKILEVGCATGIFLKVCKNLGYEPYGLDINEYGISEAKKILNENKLFCCSFEELVVEEQFDAIFMFDYIEHIINQEEVIRIAYEKLRDGGVLVITTPSVSSITNKILGERWPHYIEEHLSFFSQKSISVLLNKIGYTEVEVKKFSKIMTVNYFYSQTELKKMTILPIIKFFYNFIPNNIKNKPIKIYTGDMIAIAKK